MGLLSKKDAKLIMDPLLDDNPITIQVLGICSALAITAELEASLEKNETLVQTVKTREAELAPQSEKLARLQDRWLIMTAAVEKFRHMNAIRSAQTAATRIARLQ